MQPKPLPLEKAGADIIDVKEPSRGSLGRADLETLKAICSHPSINKMVPVTAALGEWIDLDPSTPDQLCRELDGIGLSLLKVGTSHLRQPISHQRRTARSLFDHFRQQIETRLEGPKLIPAAYADSNRCGIPPSGMFWSGLGKRDHRLLLIDTFIKDGKGFEAWIDDSEYLEILEACRESAVRLAVAGSLKEKQIEKLLDHPPDVVAVRGAACVQERREAMVEEVRVSRIRGIIRSKECL